jgi:hypothetical protein
VAGTPPRRSEGETFVPFTRDKTRISGETRILQMFRTYRTTEDTIVGEETESADITLKLITDVDGKEYVMVKKQKEDTIYKLSLIGKVTEIGGEVSFAEYRDITYARLDKELLELGIKPRRRIL